MNTIDKIKELIEFKAKLMGLDFDPNEIVEAYDSTTKTTYVMLRSINVTEYYTDKDGNQKSDVKSEPIIRIDYPSMSLMRSEFDEKEQVVRYYFPAPKLIIMFKNLIYAIRDTASE